MTPPKSQSANLTNAPSTVDFPPIASKVSLGTPAASTLDPPRSFALTTISSLTLGDDVGRLPSNSTDNPEPLITGGDGDSGTAPIATGDHSSEDPQSNHQIVTPANGTVIEDPKDEGSASDESTSRGLSRSMTPSPDADILSQTSSFPLSNSGSNQGGNEGSASPSASPVLTP